MRRAFLLAFSILLLANASASAQTRVPVPRTGSAGRPVLHRVFIEINGGLQASSLTFNDTRTDDPFLVETASWTADYRIKNAPSFDIGGGVRIWRNLIAAAAVSRFADKRTASVAGQIPHPFFFTRPRSITGETPALEHTEQAAHVSAMWVVPASRRVQLAVFGGPSLFSVKREMVEDIEYSDAYPYDTASYERSIVRSVQQTRTGFHVGGDASWFFTRNVGVGAVVRFTRARAGLNSPANDETVSLNLGGLQAGAGIRLRLGSRR